MVRSAFALLVVVTVPDVTQYALGPDVMSCGPAGGAEDASLDDDDPEAPEPVDVPDVPDVPDAPDIEPEDPLCPVDAGGELDPEVVPDPDDPPEEGGVESPAVPPDPPLVDIDDPLAVPGLVRDEESELHPMTISEHAARTAARDRGCLTGSSTRGRTPWHRPSALSRCWRS